MSRHHIASKPREVVVGWDPPLQTFILQVFDPAKDDEEELVLWLGKTPGEIPTVADLEAALVSYADLTSQAPLTPELRHELGEDQVNGAQPTELQRWVIEMFAPRG